MGIVMKKCGLTKTLLGYFRNTVNIKIVQIMNRLSKLIIKNDKKNTVLYTVH